MLITARQNDSSIGFDMLDRDHREMAETFKELNAEIASGKERSHVDDLLHRMARLTLIHFALEEGMMEATKYPMVGRHRTNHRRLMQEMNGLVYRYTREGLTLDQQCLSMLPMTHTSHIQNDDLSFTRWLDGL